MIHPYTKKFFSAALLDTIALQAAPLPLMLWTRWTPTTPS